MTTRRTAEINKVVLAYSGGLDTSVILHWLKARYGAEVVAFTADIGQGEEVEEARQKALATGASKAYAVDLSEPFVRDYVFPVLRSGAIYEGYYLLGTSFARPLIARAMIDIAEEEGADAIAHGATGKGNDQVRFELTAYALKPDIAVIAPWREWDLKGREDCIDYARAHGIAVPVSKEKPYSTDANLYHISYEGGVLEDPWAAPPKGMWSLTTDPEEAPDEPEVVEVDFEAGNPVALNGERLDPAELLATANGLAGRHGVGRVDIVENRFVGMKSRGCYETPGGTLLYHAHRAIEFVRCWGCPGRTSEPFFPNEDTTFTRIHPTPTPGERAPGSGTRSCPGWKSNFPRHSAPWRALAPTRRGLPHLYPPKAAAGLTATASPSAPSPRPRLRSSMRLWPPCCGRRAWPWIRPGSRQFSRGSIPPNRAGSS